jgi:subtilisin family serine protease
VRAIVMILAVVGSLLAVPMPAQAAEPDYIRSLEWQIAALALTDVHKKATGVDVVVAVVDSGVDAQHPDLAGQVTKGPDGSNVDIDGRGTGMAGLIAGKGHGTDAGVLGVAPGAKILPIAYAPAPGEVGDAERLASGIELAISRGAKIICIGRSSVPNERLEFAIEVAADRGVLVVAVDNSAWPATYPGVVAAIPADRNGAVPKAPASGRSTSLAVPGIDLMTTDRAAGYRISDQSGAAAVLAGAAAVVWSAYPYAKSTQVADLLRQTATDKGGYKSLNLLGALTKGIPAPAPSPTGGTDLAAPAPSKNKGSAGLALSDSTDPRRWLVVLPLLAFLGALVAWSYLAGRRPVN